MNRRRLAERLVDHAVAAAPPERRGWAEGMAAELDHVDDADALGFAFGAVWTSYSEAARLWRTWLRIGRFGAAAWTAVLGLMALYMSVWLAHLPAPYETPVSFSALLALLGGGYLAAGWCLGARRGRMFAALLLVMAALLTATVLAFGAVAPEASPLAAYAALFRGEPPPPDAFYAALLLESAVFLTLLAATGAFFRFADRWAAHKGEA